MPRKTKPKSSGPCCIFCKSGAGQFNIFTPRFQPFGTACVECEEKVTPQQILEASDVLAIDGRNTAEIAKASKALQPAPETV